MSDETQTPEETGTGAAAAAAVAATKGVIKPAQADAAPGDASVVDKLTSWGSKQVDNLSDATKKARDTLAAYAKENLEKAKKVDFTGDGTPDFTQAANFINEAPDNVKAAYKTLKEKGLVLGQDIKEVAGEAGEKTGNFLSDNQGGLMGLLGAVLIGTFTGMNVLPMLLLAAVAFLGGSFLGDKNSGILSQWIGDKEPPPEPKNESPAIVVDKSKLPQVASINQPDQADLTNVTLTTTNPLAPSAAPATLKGKLVCNDHGTCDMHLEPTSGIIALAPENLVIKDFADGNYKIAGDAPAKAQSWMEERTREKMAYEQFKNPNHKVETDSVPQKPKDPAKEKGKE